MAVLVAAAAKAFDADDIMQFSDAAKIAIVVERSLHDDFMKKLWCHLKKNLKIIPIDLGRPSLHFILTATVWSESYPVVLAAPLPCFWIYAEVGKDIVSKSVPNNLIRHGLIPTQVKNSIPPFVM